MYPDSIERLRGTAGARQVRVRAETALAAFTRQAMAAGSCSANPRLCADKGHSAGRDLAAEDGTTLHKLNIKGGRFSRADDKDDITF
jgi:hypothetical protein